jgi:hypothetical protein
MVSRRGQSCNTPTTQSTLPDQVRTRHSMCCCFSVQPRQVVSGDIDLDFGH